MPAAILQLLELLGDLLYCGQTLLQAATFQQGDQDIEGLCCEVSTPAKQDAANCYSNGEFYSSIVKLCCLQPDQSIITASVEVFQCFATKRADGVGSAHLQLVTRTDTFKHTP